MRKISIVIFTIISAFAASAQVVVCDTGDNSTAHSSAVMQLISESRGFLPPGLTTVQIQQIDDPAPGLIVFNTDSADFYGFDGTHWKALWDYPADTIRTCPDSIDYGGQWYTIVNIGNRCWFGENLNIGLRVDGSEDQQDDFDIEKYCYNDEQDSCDVYGGLYQWAEMVQYLNGATNTTSWDPVPTGYVQGICPEGWHIPSDGEWKMLEGTVDSLYGVGHSEWDNIYYRGYNSGKNLKSTSGWALNGNGTDLYGFSVLPAGQRSATGNFYNVGETARFRAATEYASNLAFYFLFNWSEDRSYRNYNETKSGGFSVRCVKD